MRLHPATNGKLRSKSTVKNDSHNTGDMESTSSLGNLFAMWVQNRGDFSQWTDASEFGGIVAQYSDLSSSTVAVWLGLTPDELPTPTEIENMVAQVDCDLTCKLKSPDGEPMTLKRIVDD
jgi:hypothetical protein